MVGWKHGCQGSMVGWMEAWLDGGPGSMVGWRPGKDDQRCSPPSA
jgi:hypothetical protein